MTNGNPGSPPEQTVPLHEGLKKFVPAELWGEFEAAKIARDALGISRWSHANPGAPKSPLTTRARELDGKVDRAWSPIYREFIRLLNSGEVQAFSQTEPPFGSWRAIPPAAWSRMRIRDFRKGTAAGPNYQLTGILVRDNRTSKSSSSIETGGRPTKHFAFIEAEFRRRAKAGQIESTLTGESRNLLALVKIKYPDLLKLPAAKTIENRLRPEYREAKRDLANKPPK